MLKKIVVVGGGYGGTLVAKAMDSIADVVLVDPREAFVNVAAQLRALTQPAWAPHAYFSYVGLLARGRHLQGRAVSADGHGVTLADGIRVDADFVVLATGSTYAYPARPREAHSSVAEALRDLQDTHTELTSAQRVLILGAGPVGLELAGEIREIWPDKTLTVLDPGSELLRGFLPELRRSLHQQLAGLGIDVRLGTTLAALPPTPEGRAGAFTVTTDAGDEIRADIWFRSFGSLVNTDYLRDGRLVDLTDDGLVPVTDCLTVRGHDNVYALGDITDLPDPKTASWAQTQAGVVVENLRAQLSGSTHCSAYVPMSESGRRIFLPLGSSAGVGQIPGADGISVVAPLEVVMERKGRDLFTGQFARRFGQ